MKFQLPLTWLYVATTYGSGTYNSNTYNGTLQIGPVTLPDTGAVLVVAGAALVAGAGGLVVWLVQRRRRVLATPSER